LQLHVPEDTHLRRLVWSFDHCKRYQLLYPWCAL